MASQNRITQPQTIAADLALQIGAFAAREVVRAMREKHGLAVECKAVVEPGGILVFKVST